MAEKRLLLFLENIGTIYPTTSRQIQFTFTPYATRAGGFAPRALFSGPNGAKVETFAYAWRESGSACLPEMEKTREMDIN